MDNKLSVLAQVIEQKIQDANNNLLQPILNHVYHMIDYN